MQLSSYSDRASSSALASISGRARIVFITSTLQDTRPVPSGLQRKVARWSGRPWRTITRAAGSEEPEVAVFRFTLGIPGFDDSLIPRIIGASSLLLLLANSVLSNTPYSTSQARAELLGIILAGCCIAVPTIDARLQEAAPGRGRTQSGAEVEGSIQCFQLDGDLSNEQRQELAWVTYALLKNTNTAGVLVCHGDRALVARGAVSSTAFRNEMTLAALSGALTRFGLAQAFPQTAYLQDRSALDKLGTQLSEFVPRGAQSLLVQKFNEGSPQCSSSLVVWSNMPRAFLRKDRTWVAAMAEKLAGFI